MKNIKTKLTIIMIVSTVSLFLITIALINIYQQHYILDKAISTLENEYEYINSFDMKDEYDYDEQRFFDVKALLLEDNEIVDISDFNYFNKTDIYFKNLYKNGKLNYNQIKKINTDFGEYYVMLSPIPESFYMDEYSGTEEFNSSMNNEETIDPSIDLLLYTDVTTASNIIKKLNFIFFIMLFITVIIEGIIGIYLGKKLENRQKKLKYFFQNASHELKTPLMSIEGYAEGIKTGVIKDSTMASEIIIKQSKKMRLLVDEILNISKLESKEYILKEEIVDIRDIIEESVESHKPLADEKNLILQLDLDEENTEVKSDALQIYKAINTIIDNAFKFALTTISIKTYRQKNHLIIEIQNDGDNISKEKLEHIFDRFYSKNNLSTGIGLAMAKEIINLCKGKISVKNTASGVMFTVKLPIL